MAQIIVVSGFLGAGKTTFILKLLSEAFSGKKVCVIENEFGSVNLDGMTLKRKAGEKLAVRKLQAGCICCTLIADLKTTISAVKAELNPDVIIIEPSGTADLLQVKKAVNIAIDDRDNFSYAVTVADASVVADFIEEFGDFYKNQIKYSDCVLLSHTEECGRDELEVAVNAVEYLKKDAPVIDSVWDEVDAGDIIAMLDRREIFENKADACEEGLNSLKVIKLNKKNAGERFRHSFGEIGRNNSAQFLSDNVFSMITIEDVPVINRAEMKCKLEKLMTDKSYGKIYRIKGIFVDENGTTVQFDGITGRIYFETVNDAVPAVCIIGKELREDKIISALSR